MVAPEPSARLAKIHAHALARALGVRNRGLIQVVGSFGFDATCAPLVPWIPAIELVWMLGLTAREREWVLRLVYERHGVLGPRAEVLLHEWVARRPSNVLMATGRRVLRAQLATLPPEERPALRARIIGPCVALIVVSGRLPGHRTDPVGAYAWLLALADNLLLPRDRSLMPEGALS
ncbi:MAG: hypothetical protein FJ202_12840 [Gemmatimonadetes bacterium]|nr:hypothetical protein [Gemmatimonadota bacterium]